MAYKRSEGTYVAQGLPNVVDFHGGAEFTSSLCNRLLDAGWNQQQELTAKIEFSVITIVSGVVIVLKGDRFGFYWPPNDPPSGTIPVEIALGDSLATIVNKFGAALTNHYGQEANITTTLTGSVISVDGFGFSDNGELCSIEPSGFATLNGATGNQGEGFMWNGGIMFNSAPLGDDGETLDVAVRFSSLDAGKRVSIRPISIINLGTNESYFDGLLLNSGNWTFVGSDLQFAVYSDNMTAGSLVLVSNMTPLADNIDRVHFACGPLRTNVGPEGGSRTSFDGAIDHIWVAVSFKDNTGVAYVATLTGNEELNQAFCFPGYSRGMALIDKLGNRIGSNNLVVKDDLGNLLPYEPFLAFCPVELDDPEAAIKIMGQLWDALIYSSSADPGDEGFLGDDDAEVLIGQTGTDSRSSGALLIRTAAFILPPILP